MRVVAVLILGLAIGVGPAQAWNSNYFKSPTGNIRCRYFQSSSDRSLACISRNNGRLVGVTPNGRSFETFDSRGYSFPVGPTLGYGDYWRIKGLYRCDSSFNGMSCRSLRTGRGFFLSRSGYRLF